MFYTGQKVVCIDDRAWLDPCDEPHPEKGGIYTIASKYTCDSGAMVELMEFPRKPVDETYEEVTGFLARRFRPLCSRPTSIEIFKRAPKPAPARIRIETVNERV